MASLSITPLTDHTGAEVTGVDFRKEDRIDPQAFNRVLWRGLMGNRPYPVARHAATKD